MKIDQIAAIGIDDEGSLWVKPATQVFPFIYREAMDVSWSQDRACLCAPKPREWSYVDWFRQIKRAAREQGVLLMIAPTTRWSNVESQLRRAIEGSG